MKVIAISNCKGGVGKTITAVSVASAITLNHGLRVLLVDADPQGSATKHLVGPNFVPDKHLGRALIEKSFDDIILTTPSGLDLVPADIRLANAVNVIEDLKNWSLRLKQALVTIDHLYDYVIIDCPPSLKTFTVMALVAANAYLIPTEPEEFSVNGLDLLNDVADYVVSAFNPHLQMLGIVVTRYNKNLRNGHHDQQIKVMRTAYGEDMMLPSIRRDRTVLEAISRGTTIYHVNPAANVSLDYAVLTETILARMNEHQRTGAVLV